MTLQRRSNILLTTLLVLLTISLTLIIIDPDLARKIHRKFSPHGPELRSFYHEMVSYHSRIDKNIPAGAHLFVGDSTIQSLCTSCITPLAINFGIGRDTTAGVLNRLPQYTALQGARSLFLSIGINDFKFRKTDEIIRNYQDILFLVPPDTEVVVNAIWPVNPTIKKQWLGYPAQIETLNKELEKICSEQRNCHYFDITGHLKDENGFLKESLQAGDGIHLNKKGYAIVINELKKLYSGSPMLTN